MPRGGRGRGAQAKPYEALSVICAGCGEEVRVRGLTLHRASCRGRPSAPRLPQLDSPSASHPATQTTDAASPGSAAGPSSASSLPLLPFASGVAPANATISTPPTASARPYTRTVYHPASGRPPLKRYYDEPTPSPPIPPHLLKPRTTFGPPFDNTADLSFAQYVVEHRHSRAEIQRLLNIQLNNVWSAGPTKLTFTSVDTVFDYLRKLADRAGNVRGPSLLRLSRTLQL